MTMNDMTDHIKSEGIGGEEQQTSSKIIVDGESITKPPMAGVQETQHESLGLSKDYGENKEKDTDLPTEEILNDVRLLGEPLASQGPYTFYSALAYRKHSDIKKKKRRRWKNQKLQNTVGVDDNITAIKSCDSSSSCDCSDDLCTCDDGSSSYSLSTSSSEWSVVRMNHFYAVRPWYSIRNSSTSDRKQKLQRHQKNSSKLATSTSAERRQHYQQSVCIGELELLWRDDSVATTTMVSSSLLKKRNSNKVTPSSQTVISNGGSERIDTMTNSNSHSGTAVSSDDDDVSGGGNGGGGDGDGNDDDSTSLLPRRRTLPRRTRQPSAKKLEAAESYAAVAAAVVSDHHPLQQSPYQRSRLSTTVLTDSTSVGIPLSSPSAQYKHGNILCSVRLYVMPDQTAAGRLGGVHGEDEVLEINTWGSSGGGDRWSSNTFINGGNGVGSIYNGGNGGGGGVDDYGYGSGSHSSGTVPSGCSGLVLRAEDFIEWVRGGLMNDDEYDDTESDGESLESECEDRLNDRDLIKTEPFKKEDKQQSKLSPITTDVGDKVKQWQQEKLEEHDDKNSSVKTHDECSLVKDVKKENLEETEKEKLSQVMIINPVEVKKEQELAIDLDKNNINKIIKEKHDNDTKSYYSKSVIDEALEAECVPLAAARIHPRQGGVTHRHHCHRPNSESLANGDGSLTNTMKQDRDDEITTVNKVVDFRDDQKCNTCKRRRRSYQYNKKTKSYHYGGNCNEQRLVVMSYSRYCRYRAQLQRKQEEQLRVTDTTAAKDDDNGTVMVATNRGIDKMNTTRVLFCRDTYDYPAELLLEPFNALHGQQQNTSVLVNHMAPKLKGWPAYPASWMSFRWNRVRRRLRHLEHGNGGNEDRRRRRRRKLKKKCHQRQNGATGGSMVLSYSSSTEDDDSDDSDSDEASSATNDGATNTTSTTSTSDSDGAPPVSSVVSKANKNQSTATTKVNGGVHQNNKKTLTAAAASNMIILNGATGSTGTVNKRTVTDIGQFSQQQSTKRRRIVYAIGGQPQNQQTQQRQRIIYQQQQQQHSKPRQLQQQQQFNQRSRQSEQFNQLTQAQRNHHMLVQQQQKRLQSLNRRLPAPISSIQSSTTRVIHHHLPPSVTIMPVIVPSTSSAAHQQQQRNNNRIPNRQKQYSPATISASQRQNNNSNRQSNSFPPVIIEYDKDHNQEYESDDNGRRTTTTIEAAMASCQRRIERQNCEDEQKQQREEEERQRRWLVDALRLGGLEVTAVPLKVNTNSGNSDSRDISTSSAVTSQRQRQLRQRGVSFELLPVDHNKSGIIPNERGNSNSDSDSDSVVMTVTPDVICILNKSQQQMQESPEDKSSKSLGTRAHPPQQQRRSLNISNNNSNSGRQPEPTIALSDKINRAIDSLKQQQQQSSNTDVPIKNNSNNVLVLGGSSNQYSNNTNNRQQQRLSKNSGIVGFRQQQTSSIIDRSVNKLGSANTTITTTAKQLKQISQLSSAVNSNLQSQQLRKGQLPFSSLSMAGSSSAAANLEITLVPVTSSSNTNSTKLFSQQQQQKRNSFLAGPNSFVGSSEILPSAYLTSSMSVNQLQRRNTVGTNISPASIIDSSKSRHQQQRNNSGMSVSTKASSSQQQQQQIVIMTSSTVGPQNQQQLQIDKRKPQQNKKD